MNDESIFSLFAPEQEQLPMADQHEPWIVMLVDDEPDIHAVLRMALQDVVVEGHPLMLISAMSAAEARLRFAEHPGIALVLLDVVMETDHAGLDLVRYIRDELGNRSVQILLVTGQPGYAPQRDVVTDYDIDDYHMKSELTSDRIFSSVYTALRTYHIMCNSDRLLQQLKSQEQTLRESEMRLRSILLTAMDGYLLLDSRGGMIEVNDTLCRMTGYSESELLDMAITDLEATESPEETVEHMKKVAETGEDRFTTRHRRKNGMYFDVEISVKYRPVDGGQYVAFLRDITEEKKIDEIRSFLLQCGVSADGEDFFRQLARYLGEHLAVDGVSVSALENGGLHARTLVRYVNGVFLDTVSYALDGTPCGATVGKTVCCFPEGVSGLFPGDVSLQQMQAESYIGTTIWNSNGTPIGLISLVAGAPLITQQLAASVLQLVAMRTATELERREGEKQLRMLSQAVEQSPASILIADTHGTVEFINPRFIQMTGYEADTLVGQDWGISWSCSMSPDEYERMHDTVISGKIWEGELQSRRASDELYWERVTVSVIRNRDGEPINYLTIKEDITEQKRLEEQLRQAQKMETIGQLSGGVAHDFNNILMVIMGYSNLMAMDPGLNKSQREAVERITEASEKGAQLTHGLLAFSRKQVLDPHVIDLNAIVQHVQKFLMRIIGEDIRLKLLIHGQKLPAKVDHGQIEQVLINLATNARDAMPNGGVLTIETGISVIPTVAMEGISAEGERCGFIQVTDTGVGMDRKTIGKIFEPFFTTKQIGKGTGLGMSIVYGIVKQHNGSITVSSRPGEGTSFKVLIPLHEEAPIEVRPDAAPVEAVDGTETILVAEDDDTVREIIRSVLTRFGYTVIEARDGEEAVEVFARAGDTVSLVLMDVIMPKKNGEEAYRDIKKLKPDTKVLFASGYTADFIKDRGVPDEAIELIMKPVKPFELLRKVRRMLDS